MNDSHQAAAAGSHSGAFSRLTVQLAASGLNLFALLPVQTLEPQWREMLPETGQLPLARQTLMLVGNAGPAFWAACQCSVFAGSADQVDRFAVEICRTALQSLPGNLDYRLLYPTIAGGDTSQCHLPLQALGQMAGWHQNSPLGIGINPQHGLWFAYRCLFLLDVEYPGSTLVPTATQNATLASRTDVCLNCKTQDCIKSCPSEALTLKKQPDMQRCMQHRLKSQSECAMQCLARNACPIGTVSRYTAEQTNYHYNLSLASIKRYVEQ